MRARIKKEKKWVYIPYNVCFAKNVKYDVVRLLANEPGVIIGDSEMAKLQYKK